MAISTWVKHSQINITHKCDRKNMRLERKLIPRLCKLCKAGWLRHQENGPLPLKAQTGGWSYCEASLLMPAKRSLWNGSIGALREHLYGCFAILRNHPFCALQR